MTYKNKPKETEASFRPFLRGFALGLAEMHRSLSGGADSEAVRRACHNARLSYADFESVGVADFDLRELRKAGVL